MTEPFPIVAVPPRLAIAPPGTPLENFRSAITDYLASATVTTASTFVLATEGSVPGLWGLGALLLGLLLFAAGVLFAVSAAERLVSTLPSLRATEDATANPPEARATASLYWLLLGSVLATIAAGVLLLLGALFPTEPALSPAGVLVAAGAALGFLAALLVPPILRASDPRRRAAWAAAAFGVAGIAGAAGLALTNRVSNPVGVEWLTAAALPLLNWNAPFGPLVVVSAFFLRWSYGGPGEGAPAPAGTGFSAGPGRGNGGPGQGPSP